MKKHVTLCILQVMLLSVTESSGQHFDRANSYSISNCNEVAALTADNLNNTYIAGVHGASQFLPYTGNCYLLKADTEGTMLWTKYFTGQVQIGDMVISGNDLWIIGQSNGVFDYNGITYGLPSYHMFIMKTDTAGTVGWISVDNTRNGSLANLVAGDDGFVAVNFKGVSNTGNYIQLLDSGGNVIRNKEISGFSTSITDLALYNGRVYLNGAFNGSDSLVVDGIVIHQPPVEHAAFVLALDSDFVAEWASVDVTINNRDGRIVADHDGVYAYFSVLEPPFTIVNVLKRFTFDGQLTGEQEIPFFTTAVTLYPDMAISPGALGIYAGNAFNHHNHEVILFDKEMNLIGELSVEGLSDLYSGQIAAIGDGFMIAHVHSGDLNFNGAFTLVHSGTGKNPYTGKLSLSESTGISANHLCEDLITFYPNPAGQSVNVVLPGFINGSARLKIFDASGKIVFHQPLNAGVNKLDIRHIAPGIYVGYVEMPDHKIVRKKLIIR